MPAYFTDDFNRPDENPATGWTGQTNASDVVEIVSNTLRAAQQTGRYYTIGDAATADQFAQCDVTMYATSAVAGPAVRVSTDAWAGAQGYSYRWGSWGDRRIHEFSGFGENTLATLGSTGNTGTVTMRLEVAGDEFTTYDDGVETLSYTGTVAELDGFTGVGVEHDHGGTSALVDNFSAGDIVPAYFEDDFNRPDSTDIGSDWLNNYGNPAYAPEDGYQIVSNRLQGQRNDGTMGAYWATPTNTNAMFAQTEWYAADSPWYWVLGVNGDGTSDINPEGIGYALAKNEWYSDVWIKENGATRATAGGFPTSGDMGMARIEHDGAGNVAGYFDGVEAVSYTGGTALAGKHVYVGGHGGQYDNFSAGDYIGRGFLADDFSAYTTGTALSAAANWDTNTRADSGVPTIDNSHTDHHTNVGCGLVDCSTTGANFCTYQGAGNWLSSNDQHAQITAFTDHDFFTNNQIGVLLRLQDSDPTDINGYVLRVQPKTEAGGNLVTWEIIYVVDDVSTDTVDGFIPLSVWRNERGCAVIQGSIVGDIATIRCDGQVVGSVDINTMTGKHDTGKYVGFELTRGTSATNSQPFATKWMAWVDGYSG